MTSSELVRARLKPDPIKAARRHQAQEDVAVLVASLAAGGVQASDDEVYEAWRRHSDAHAASWLALYGDPRANRDALLPYFDLDR